MISRVFLVLLSALACKGEPQRSYCEALCDWAIACHADERDIDVEAATEACLADTRASDASCERAETGSINPAAKKLLTPCVTAIDDAAAAGECKAFTGSVDEIKTAAPPTECATQAEDAIATFNVAKDSSKETGAELCQRYTNEFCSRADECILGDFSGEIPQTAIDALGGTPEEVCILRLAPIFTDQCIAEDLYAAEDGAIDVNAARQSARECLTELGDTDCVQLFAGAFSPACAGSVSDPADLLAIGNALLVLSQDFAEYAE